MSEESNKVIYEQPLSERVRSFRRLEHLFTRAHSQLDIGDLWATRATLEALNDIMSLMGRFDVKKELIKELERHATTLGALAKNPNVDSARLEDVVAQVKTYLGNLRTREHAPGLELRHNEFLSAVRQRMSIPAGTCDFDIPSLHYWLRRAPEERNKDLVRWLSAFEIVHGAIDLCLMLIRESAFATHETATAGFFQQSLDSANPTQMIRVALNPEVDCFPEISAGKHRFTVRFMRLDEIDTRPTQTNADVEFDLIRCVI